MQIPYQFSPRLWSKYDSKETSPPTYKSEFNVTLSDAYNVVVDGLPVNAGELIGAYVLSTLAVVI
jgi:hypothetical protein